MSFCDDAKSQQYFAGMQTIQRNFDISLSILSRNDYLRRLRKVPFHVRELGEILHFQRLLAAKHNRFFRGLTFSSGTSINIRHTLLFDAGTKKKIYRLQ